MSANECPKQEIEVLIKGPFYTCRSCKSLLRIPSGYQFLEDEFSDATGQFGRGNQYATAFYYCPVCDERNNVFRVTYKYDYFGAFEGKDLVPYE